MSILGALRHRLASERGFTMVELLVVLALSTLIFGAVLAMLDAGLRVSQTDQVRNETQDVARSAIEQMSRQLRDIASPTASSAGALEKATSYDIVSQTVDPNTVYGGSNKFNQVRIRYCLDNSNPSNENLWMQTQTWTTATAPAAASTSACPGTGWTTTNEIATNLSNEINGQNRPLFIYSPSSWATTSDISGLDIDLFVNQQPNQAHPGETELRTGADLRNSNAPPTAGFTVTQVNGHVLLNASLSSDPNGQSLGYQWTLNGSNISGATTQQYDAGSFTRGSSQIFGLVVTDGGGLSATSTQTVTIQ